MIPSCPLMINLTCLYHSYLQSFILFILLSLISSFFKDLLLTAVSIIVIKIKKIWSWHAALLNYEHGKKKNLLRQSVFLNIFEYV